MTKNCLIIAGNSGAGRSTALNILEDAGYQAIANPPIAHWPAILQESEPARPVAIGIGVDSPEHIAHIKSTILDMRNFGIPVSLMLLEARADVLARRFHSTRRIHHFLSTEGSLERAIEADQELTKHLYPLSDWRVDTSDMNPTGLKSLLYSRLNLSSDGNFLVHITSFSYKNGLPPNADFVFDCRFLQNPYWEMSLREKNGRDEPVQNYVKADKNYKNFIDDISRMMDYLLIPIKEQGRNSLNLAFGCSGGQHRSVSVAEEIYKILIKTHWQAQITHRELDATKV